MAADVSGSLMAGFVQFACNSSDMPNVDGPYTADVLYDVHV